MVGAGLRRVHKVFRRIKGVLDTQFLDTPFNAFIAAHGDGATFGPSSFPSLVSSDRL